jgi:hypothetical protein
MEKIDLIAFGASTRVGLGLSCPSCQTLLSVAIDPIAVKADTVNEVVARLR